MNQVFSLICTFYEKAYVNLLKSKKTDAINIKSNVIKKIIERILMPIYLINSYEICK
jgi:hypothetical protein